MKDTDKSIDQANRPPQRQRRRRREFSEALAKAQDDRRLWLADIGQRLREIRSGRGLSIRDLSRKSGLNVNTLSMIENGKNLPSLETLQQLSLTLDIPITTFFESNNHEHEIAHYKVNQRRSVPFAHGKLENVGDGMPHRGLEVFLVTLNPYSDSGKNLMVHTGREAVYCLEGQLTYMIKDQTYVLEPGDSLFFDAHLPHRWKNTGDSPSYSLLVLCPSDELDRTTERHFNPE